MHAYRTHTCGALRLGDAGATARLPGWVHRKRDHGQLLFVDLRDHYGITQCVIDISSPLFAAVGGLRLESVVTFTGRVIERTPETINPNLPTGEVELVIDALELLSAAEPLPFPVNTDAEYPEDMRLTYRFLDLRREGVHANIMLRSAVIASIRRRMIEQGFTEFQTPILTASSPEGARPYLVPSRIHPGKFYALPQAPQQFKQLLMVSGFDRYFQIAPCFRDEAARADRSPGEFYQLDFEMCFVTQEDVFAAIEPVLHGVFEEFGNGRAVTPAPFPRIKYNERGALRQRQTRSAQPADYCRCIGGVRRIEFPRLQAHRRKRRRRPRDPGPGSASRPRSSFQDKMDAWAKSEMSAPGLGYITLEESNRKPAGRGPIANNLTADELAKIARLAGSARAMSSSSPPGRRPKRKGSPARRACGSGASWV